MKTITENTLAPPSIKYRVIITADQARLDEVLKFCRDKWGHSKGKGQEFVWAWRVQARYRDRKFIFSFANEEDALAFKLIKG